jgi:ComF family protein
MQLSVLVQDFLGLFFPELCAACGKNLFRTEQEICSACMYRLPLTYFHQDPENRVARQFWGRIPLVQAGAFLYFNKGGRVQNLMHQLKYQKRQQVGEVLGKLYGEQLVQSTGFIRPDLIIPVPLHPKKLKIRGYNQSECIAKGLVKGLGTEISIRHLIRQVATETQTKKARFSRFENMKEAFELKDAADLNGKHILLVDDVLTTGATLEACAACLLKNSAIRLSIAVLAFAE